MYNWNLHINLRMQLPYRRLTEEVPKMFANMLSKTVLALVCMALCLLITGCFAQTPKKPQLSSFTAELSVLNVGQQIDHVMFYASVEEKKLLQTVPVGNLSTDIQFYMWVIVQKNMTIEYDTMKPFGYCVGIEAPEDPGFTNFWYWLKKAVYNGTKTFNGQKVDTWSYEDKKMMSFFEVGVLSSNPDKPVYYFNTETGVIIFNKYDGTPPQSSVFDIPANCKLEPSARESQVHFTQYKNVFKSKLY